MRRAAHQLFDRPLILDDPFALRILGEAALARMHENAAAENASLWAVGLRKFIAARSRFAEENLARAVSNGVRQYVVLGAGLDTFACRNPWPHVSVFEVDFPDTQAWKRACLAQAGIPVPATLRFAAVDFERHSLADGLAAAGFNPTQPAFFSWLGVVPYLTREAAFATLRCIAALPHGTGVAFDYSIPPDSMTPDVRAAFEHMAERAARAGEPFRLFFHPEPLHAELHRLGFRVIEDLDSAAIRNRWHTPQPQPPTTGTRAGHLLCAWL